ncbi:hypothetical protein BAC3_01647 [uncultured bacterium]|nr:hypothetical protein BAC3_01647 [uncultured bacterium]
MEAIPIAGAEIGNQLRTIRQAIDDLKAKGNTTFCA